MKKIATILFLFIGFVSFSQSNFTVFNNDGKQFYVILNGIKQNSVAQTNVYVSGIKNGSYSVKLIFADGITADIDKNFFIEEPSDITTRVIFKDGKGKLQLIGMEPTKGMIKEESAVVYRPNDTAVYTDAVTVNQTITTTNTTSTTTNSTNQSGNVNGETINMNVGINAGGTTQGMNVNINVNDPMMNTQTTTGNVQQTQMTTTTTSVTTTGSQTQMNQNSGTTQVTSTSPAQITCKNILENADKMAEDLKDLMMDEDRVTAIKLDLEKYCLTANQAYKLVETLNFEDNRLEAAKYLYDRMIDKDKANVLFSLFNFDSSKIEFREYMNKKK